MIEKTKNLKLAVIGLGYVGLPLALEFAKKRKVIGFDINKKRINELKSFMDTNLETTKKQFEKSKLIKFTNNRKDLKLANFFIITVPTPINKFKKPDLDFLIKSSEIVGKILKKKDITFVYLGVNP